MNAIGIVEDLVPKDPPVGVGVPPIKFMNYMIVAIKTSKEKELQRLQLSSSFLFPYSI